jgi:hypothetical protein
MRENGDKIMTPTELNDVIKIRMSDILEKYFFEPATSSTFEKIEDDAWNLMEKLEWNDLIHSFNILCTESDGGVRLSTKYTWREDDHDYTVALCVYPSGELTCCQY